ncbi:MAG: hypothetical protein ABIR15_09560 [Chitinophagaceae bacterium]
MKHLLLMVWFGLAMAYNTEAQNYHAIQGSSYAGALGVHNNPASIVNTPFKWDVVLFGAQVKSSTNAFSIHNYSLLSSPANSLYRVDKGQYKRKANMDVNLNLLNARIALNRKSSLAFGANIRSYTNLKTSDYNFIDTLDNVSNFLAINPEINSVNAKVFSSSWLEGYISYARTLSDNEFGRLNAGITVKVSRGISGAYANIDNIGFSRSTQNNTTVYNVNAANIIYGYSSNYDRWQNSNSSSQNINNFISYTEGGASVDAGIEYLIKPQGTTSFYDEEDYYDYDWKIGLSLLDIGGNQYKYGIQSRIVNGVKTNITGATLDNKFDSTIGSFKQFNDSLGTVINGNAAGGKFTVVNPTRLVANIDHYLTGNFYINAELSINIPLASIKKTYLQVKAMNLLTVTPRWETKRFGFYMPVQYNNQNQFWVGGAFKAGPLLLGVHNLVNLFSKSSAQNGGGYIALIFRSPKGPSGKTDKRLNCPKPIW